MIEDYNSINVIRHDVNPKVESFIIMYKNKECRLFSDGTAWDTKISTPPYFISKVLFDYLKYCSTL